MKAYMTNGTFDYLQKLQTKYPEIDFYYMNGGSSTLVYYEGTGKSIFAAGREYEVVIENGKLQKEGFVVMNNIPVTEDGTTAFEDKFKQRQQHVDQMPGFQAFRFLRPIKDNTYVVLTQWASKDYFENWKNSESFQKAHKDGATTKPPAYFADRPFISLYQMMDLEDE